MKVKTKKAALSLGATHPMMSMGTADPHWSQGRHSVVPWPAANITWKAATLHYPLVSHGKTGQTPPAEQGYFEQLLDSASWKILGREALISVCLLLEVVVCIKHIFLTAGKASQGAGLSSGSFACEKPCHKICKAAGAECLPKVMMRARKVMQH